MDARACTACKETKRLDQFAKDRSKSSGVRPICKACDREKTRARRAAGPRKPFALVLTPDFPEPPAAVVEESASTVAAPAAVGSMRAEVERNLAAMNPPPGDSDAVMVAQARTLADLFDRVYWTDDASRACPTLAGKITAAFRELKATRASAGESAVVKSERKRAASY